MRLLQWLRARAQIDGEPSVDRTRKDVVVPVYIGCGLFFLIYTAARMTQAFGAEETRVRWGRGLAAAGGGVVAAALLPVGVYVAASRRITRQLCEYPVAACTFGIVFADAGMMLMHDCDVSGFAVLVLDAMLVCDCGRTTAKAVIVCIALWLVVRGVLRTENVANDPCAEDIARFSMQYLLAVPLSCLDFIIVMVDYQITRGFAQSMREQSAMIEASIQVTELAAVSLSKYETGEARTLLEGAEGERLPDGLREALLQLVANLAQYRPYLPQSCLPADDSCDTDVALRELSLSEEVQSPDEPNDQSPGVPATVERDVQKGTPMSEESPQYSRSQSSGPWAIPHTPIAPEVRNKRVALLAVNTASFLDVGVAAVSPVLTARLVCFEVELFVGEVATERGVVDLVSGDHLFANFNASRLCTTASLGASRVSWSMTKTEGDAPRGRSARRTACVCGGTVLCGDIGTSELRRFMLVGGVVNTAHCLERVAARLGTVLLDERVAADADVAASFFKVLVERVVFPKRGPKPFLVWQLAGLRRSVSGPAEWMYELERQDSSPHDTWNERLEEWLRFGRPFEDSELESGAPLLDVSSLTREREQTRLVEAGVAGGTVSFGPPTLTLSTL
eukprot:TRINITY_DN16069_c1_g1_i1.p1 TRINITY_DN16069_c1_g1~~TRINITY_DN16069_c1_g1_i1.p1  ORF type:complete len:621 (+),score=163.01 TRINITY_DN16069_c1_g1_i1:108-1970(+)